MGTVTDRWTAPTALDFTTNQDITEQNLDDIVSNEQYLYNRVPVAGMATGVNATTTSTTFVATSLTLTLAIPAVPASGPNRAYRIVALAFGNLTGTAACVGISIGGGAVQGGPQTGAPGYCCSGILINSVATSVTVTVYLRSTSGASVSFDTSFQLVAIALPQ